MTGNTENIIKVKSNRFIVYLPEPFNGIRAWSIYKLIRPIYDFKNDSWSDTSISIYETALRDYSTSDILSRGIINYRKLLATKDTNYIIWFETLDGDGKVIEKCEIEGDFKFMLYDELDYHVDSQTTVKLIFETIDFRINRI